MSAIDERYYFMLLLYKDIKGEGRQPRAMSG